MYEGQGHFFRFVQLGIYDENGNSVTDAVYEHSLRMKQTGRPEWTHLCEIVDVYLEHAGYDDYDYEFVDAHRFNEAGYVTAATMRVQGVYYTVRAYLTPGTGRQN